MTEPTDDDVVGVVLWCLLFIVLVLAFSGWHR